MRVLKDQLMFSHIPLSSFQYLWSCTLQILTSCTVFLFQTEKVAGLGEYPTGQAAAEMLAPSLKALSAFPGWHVHWALGCAMCQGPGALQLPFVNLPDTRFFSSEFFLSLTFLCLAFSAATTSMYPLCSSYLWKDFSFVPTTGDWKVSRTGFAGCRLHLIVFHAISHPPGGYFVLILIELQDSCCGTLMWD